MKRLEALAEREGFEPSEELNTPHTLSKRAPSASRTSLRGSSAAHAATGEKWALGGGVSSGRSLRDREPTGACHEERLEYFEAPEALGSAMSAAKGPRAAQAFDSPDRAIFG